MSERCPQQPVYKDEKGVLRFRANAIVKWLLEHSDVDINDLSRVPFSPGDRAQFAQLLGYSLDGWADLPYTSGEDYEKALRSYGETWREENR